MAGPPSLHGLLLLQLHRKISFGMPPEDQKPQYLQQVQAVTANIQNKKKLKIFRIPYSTPLLSKTIFTLFYPKRCQRISTLISKVLRHHRAHINTLLVSYLKYNAGKILLFIPSKRYLINLNFKPYLPKRIAVISVN